LIKLSYRQCTYKVTLRRVPVTLLQWKSNKYDIFWVRVCRPSYPARKAQSPH
jgi:hypothetical protein